MMHSERRRELKRKAFERDGWYEAESNCWYAMCAFGCGEILIWETATLDRYPIMGQHGGTYILENVRLACRPCNSGNCNYKERLARKELRRKKGSEKQKRRTADRLARISQSDSEKQKRKMINRAINNEPRPPAMQPPQYPEEVKRKLRENYPKSAGRDRNGILVDAIDVVWDNEKGKFRYDR